jgi:hypothetical protein
MSITPTALSVLGRTVAEVGIDADPQGLTALADAARDAGISPVLTDVMVDTHAPEVVRVRAFGRVACAVSRLVYRPTRDSLAIAA